MAKASRVSRSDQNERQGTERVVDVAVRSRSMRRRHGPVQPAAPVAPVVLSVAYRAQRCVLPRDPVLIRETISREATIAEAPCAAPTVDTWPIQQVLLPLLTDSQDFHRDRGARTRGSRRRRVARGTLSTRAARYRRRRRATLIGMRRARTARRSRARGPVVTAVRFGGKGIINLYPVGAVEAEGGPPATSLHHWTLLCGHCRVCRDGAWSRGVQGRRRHSGDRERCAEERARRPVQQGRVRNVVHEKVLKLTWTPMQGRTVDARSVGPCASRTFRAAANPADTQGHQRRSAGETGLGRLAWAGKNRALTPLEQ